MMNRNESKYAFLYMVVFNVLAFASILLVMTMFSGCRSQHPCMVIEKTITDSIAIRDTTYKVELVPYRDSISSPDTSSFLCNPYAYSYASYSNGLLNHSLGIYPFATATVKVPYFVEKIRRIEVPKPYAVERKLSWWERTKIDLGGYAIGTVVITILIVVVKMVYKLKKGG